MDVPLGETTCDDGAIDVVAGVDVSEWVGVDVGADDDDVAVDCAEVADGVDSWLDAWVGVVVGASVRRVCVGFDVGSDEVGAGVEVSGA